MPTEHTDHGSRQDPEKQSRLAIALMSRWGIDGKQAARILGLAANCDALPKDTQKILEAGGIPHARLSHLLGIHARLRQIYPQPDVCYAWMKKPNGAFEGLSPVEVVDRFEIRGMQMVLAYLERALHH